MKKLFFILLVVNLVIWLWGQRDRLAGVTETAPPGLGAIRLLDDAELAARRQAAATQAAAPELPSTDVPADGGAEPRLPVAARVAGVEPEPAAADAGTPPPTTDDAPPHDVAAPAEAAAAPEASAEAAEATGGEAAARVAEADVSAPGEAPPFAAAVDTPGAVERAADAVVASAAEHEAAPASPVPEQPAEAVGEDGPPGPEAMADPTPVVEVERLPGPVAAAAGDAGQEAVPVEAIATTSTSAATAAAEPAAGESAGTAESPPSEQPAVTMTPAPAVDDAAVIGAAEPPPASPPVADADAAPGTAAVEPAVPASEAREVRYLCESIGPFADRAAAARFRDGIAAPLRAATLREERVSRAVRHWVLAPAQPSKEALTTYLASLAQAGVGDTWRIPSGPLAGRLSLGVFRSAENARKHADTLAAKGVATEIRAPTDAELDRVYWIDYERPSDAAPPNPGAAQNRPAHQVVPRSCGRVAGHSALP